MRRRIPSSFSSSLKNGADIHQLSSSDPVKVSTRTKEKNGWGDDRYGEDNHDRQADHALTLYLVDISGGTQKRGLSAEGGTAAYPEQGGIVEAHFGDTGNPGPNQLERA
jgi:hypothetical protein